MTRVTGHIDDHEAISLLQRLVRLNTENPPGNEGPAARFLAEYLEPLGFETEYHQSAPERGSLVARLPGSGGGRTLVMNGHLDIGPIGTGWTKDPLGGEIEDGKIYGRA
jgi:succinyl-diaminopimelate desuccinylase